MLGSDFVVGDESTVFGMNVTLLSNSVLDAAVVIAKLRLVRTIRNYAPPVNVPCPINQFQNCGVGARNAAKKWCSIYTNLSRVLGHAITAEGLVEIFLAANSEPPTAKRRNIDPG